MMLLKHLMPDDGRLHAVQCLIEVGEYVVPVQSDDEREQIDAGQASFEVERNRQRMQRIARRTPEM